MNQTDYQDYIIRMNELENPQAQQAQPGEEQDPKKKKKKSRFRGFLGRSLKKPLTVGFSQDAKSSFTTLPRYRRYNPLEDSEE